MSLEVTKIEVWACQIPDEPGGLAKVLKSLGDAGANLECVIGRRQPEKPGSGVVFLTPLKGSKVQRAAQAAGFNPAQNVATLKVEGADKPGMGSRITEAIAGAGVNLRGVSCAVSGKRFAAYFGFDSSDDATKAARAIKALDAKKKKAK